MNKPSERRKPIAPKELFAKLYVKVDDKLRISLKPLASGKLSFLRYHARNLISKGKYHQNEVVLMLSDGKQVTI